VTVHVNFIPPTLPYLI